SSARRIRPRRRRACRRSSPAISFARPGSRTRPSGSAWARWSAGSAAAIATRDRIDQPLFALDELDALEALADALGDADRRRVLGMDHADHLLPAHDVERVGERTARRLGRVTLAPLAARERPADLEAGPSLGIDEADAADHAI